jgi:uncharacterized membrane protein YidH (DUF202 family)
MGGYRELDANAIVDTLTALERRVGERFAGSGLRRVAADLLAVAQATAERIEDLQRPNRPLRLAVSGLILILLSIVTVALANLRWPDRFEGVQQFVQVLESAINDVVFVGIAIAFLVTLERRLKRRRALRSIHELRSIAHVVDMHQLTKDPEQFAAERLDTPSSPERALSRFELSRYLDYCSETLSLTSKVAALWAQRFDDSVVLAAVNEVEALTTGLSSKIWQKIMILGARGPADSAIR